MTQRRAPKQASRSRAYGEALQEMRSAARDGVEEAISRAVILQPPGSARGRPRKPKEDAGYRASALFDGVIDAVAEAIIDSARPGSEHAMAHLVAQMLVARVYQHSCAGSA